MASVELVRTWPGDFRAGMICGTYMVFWLFFTSRMPILTLNPLLSSRLGTGTHFHWIAVHEAEWGGKMTLLKFKENVNFMKGAN